MHLRSVLGRTELCHEVWTPGPQKPQIISNENHHLALRDSSCPVLKFHRKQGSTPPPCAQGLQDQIQKEGAPETENPLFIGFSAGDHGLRPWSRKGPDRGCLRTGHMRGCSRKSHQLTRSNLRVPNGVLQTVFFFRVLTFARERGNPLQRNKGMLENTTLFRYSVAFCP